MRRVHFCLHYQTSLNIKLNQFDSVIMYLFKQDTLCDGVIDAKEIEQ